MQRSRPFQFEAPAIPYPFLDPVGARERRPVLFGLFLILALLGVMLTIGVVGVVLTLMGRSDLLMIEAAPQDPTAGESIIYLAVLALGLASMGLPILLAARAVYGRPLKSFLWPARRFSGGLFLIGCGAMLAAMVAVGTIGWLVLGGGGPTEDLGSPLFAPEPLVIKLAYVAVAMVALLVAAFAEEAVFRGALLQVTGGFTRHGLIICVINGLLFSAIHLDPDPVAFVARAASGAVWAWAALRLGGLEFALGGHWTGNLLLALTSDFTETVQPGRDLSQDVLWINLAISLVVLATVEMIARRRRV